jgi:predicted nucleic acid-binding protein
MTYVDTSVLAAYYCPETLSRNVQAHLGQLDTPAISELVELELYSAVAMKIRVRELSEADARRILSLFQVHLADGYYRVVPVESREYQLARNWIASCRTPLRTLDALHLATAFANDLSLLTADRTLARSAVQLGLRCELIG